MAIKTNESEVLHRIRVKLYPNYLPNAEGMYIARTENEALLSIEQICAAMRERGGYTGNFENLTKNIRQFLDEAAYQLCDGFAVNMGYYSIHPNVGGTFDSVSDVINPKKNPINFKFRSGKLLRRLIQFISVDIIALSGSNAYIGEFINKEDDTDSDNSFFVPGGIFILYGNKIKVAGDDPGCGVFFVPVDDPSKAVKVKRLVENTPSKIIGKAPDIDCQRCRIEVRTQFTGSGTFLKKPRIIASDFVIEA
jgi:hypothetical protein